MTCKAIHSIELRSFGESSLVLNRTLFQLQGAITGHCACQIVQIKNGSDPPIAVPIFKKNFNHLIRLQKDKANVIELTYCSAKKSIRLEQKSIDKVLHDIQPLYIINRKSDGKFQSTSDDTRNNTADALLKIDLAMELAQVLFSSKLNESELFGERAFVLKKCEVFNSELDVDKARSKNQWDLYDYVAKELIDREGPNIRERRKFVCFMSCTKFDGLRSKEEYSYANIHAKTRANPALGGDFLCLMGSGCFYSWPNSIDEVVPAFKNKKKVDLTQVLDDSNYRQTYGGTFASSLGSLVHEIGHCFDLAHTESGLMGADIDFVHRFFLSEIFTEVLPERCVRNCQLVKQSEAKNVANQRITKIKKPGGIFLEKYYEQKNSDLTFFEPNCLITLWFHRWFTQCAVEADELTYDDKLRLVKSKKHPIRLVEIRELAESNSMLIKFWPLLDQNVNEFKIPDKSKLKDVTLFVITANGDILKKHM